MLTPDDLKALFAPLPDASPVWESCSSLLSCSRGGMRYSVSPPYPENVGLTQNGGLPIDVFLGLWFLVLRYECVRTVYSVLQLGYWKEYTSLVRWVRY